MAETRDQQPHSPAAPPPGQYLPDPPSGQYYAPPVASSAPPSSVDIAERVVRLLARRLISLCYRLWRLIVPRLGWVLLTAMLLGVVGLLSLLLVLPRLVARAPEADMRASLITPAPAVVDFLRGQQTYNADLMWDSFSPAFQAALEEREVNREALAQQAERERQAGQRYRDPAYIGGVQLDGRRTMYFYAVDIVSPEPERNGTVSIVFTVDADGKIVNVRM